LSSDAIVEEEEHEETDEVFIKKAQLLDLL
jgi:hypothetical protein